jgi:hypothetical protein
VLLQTVYPAEYDIFELGELVLWSSGYLDEFDNAEHGNFQCLIILSIQFLEDHLNQVGTVLQ